MNKQVSTVPKLRFPEFLDSGEWVEKEFQKVFNSIPTKSYQIQSNQFLSTGYFPVIDQGKELIAGYSNEKNKIFNNTGIIVFGDHTTILKFIDFDFIVGADGTKLFDNKTECLRYLFYYLECNKIKQDGYKRHFSILKQIKILLPRFKEQQKIADCLSSLDALITTQTQKLQALQQHKKGLMQNLFSAEGKTTPKLRFPEFVKVGEWMEKTLGEVAIFTKGKGISKSDIAENGKLPCIRYGELYTHYNETISDIKSHTNLDPNDLILSEVNDVIIPASGETQIDIATASCVLGDGIALGGDLNIIKTNINGVFLAYYLNSAKKRDIAQIAQGISVVHLYSNQLKSLIVNIPNPQEQQKIADCLSSLDALITTQTQKLQALQQHKKGLMQGLFPINKLGGLNN